MAAEVRRADTKDAAQIAEIIAEVRGDSNPTGFEDAQTPEQIEAWITRQGGSGAMFVVDDGRHVLAFAALDFDSSEPDECSFGAWVRVQNRRQGHGTALAEDALAFARDRGYKRIRARLPQDNEPALSYLSSIGALVPMTNPGTRFELPI
ncbi:MAG TPA: GNAT family N-acetyltransferase [Dehalococcoidia bacterium]|nr:GNAT family N-acetyltransferase [Dehalococcoidia bacterium]